MKVWSAALLLLVFSAAVSRAGETAHAENVALGARLAEEGNFASAAEILSPVFAAAPADPDAAYYYGVALNRLDDEQAATVLKKALMLAPERPEVNFELGLHYYQKVVFAEAGDYFENTILLAPGSRYARAAEEYLRSIEEKTRDKRWGVDLLAGFQHDSNVILNGTNMPLPAGISGKSDVRTVVSLKGNYVPVKGEREELSLGLSLYQSLHRDLNDFNVTQSTFDLAGEYALSPEVKANGRYAFEYVLLDGHKYGKFHSISPALHFSFGRHGLTRLAYRYRSAGYDDSADFPSNSLRDGKNHLFTLSHLLPLSKSVAVTAEYSHDEDNTRRDFWDYRGDRGLLGLRLGLPQRMVADLFAEVYRKDYQGVDPNLQGGDPSFDTVREDNQTTVSLSLTKPLSERWSIAAGWLFVRNSSNIDDFDYVRRVTSLFFTGRL